MMKWSDREICMSKDVDLSDMLFPTVHLRLLDGWAKGIQNT